MTGTRRNGQKPLPAPSDEAGQSIVLIALIFLALLAFVALAVDVGFAFVRSAQFSSAVDSAALAGVVDLDFASPTNTADADKRAAQFLATNGWPTTTLSSLVGSRSLTDQGIPQYSLTVTWPVDNFFMKVIGIDGFKITHGATAAFFAQSELYTTSAFDRGHIRKTSQFIYGQNACTKEGDPVSPLNSSAPGVANPDYSDTEGLFRYRISVPSNYTQTNILRVELFDTDSVNLLGNSATVAHSLAYGGGTSSMNCNSTSAGMGDQCVIYTGENAFARSQNPYWLLRVDENWDANCNQSTGNGNGQAVTSYALYYFDNLGNRVPLARYMDDNSLTAFTDMKWVSPGATAGVPASVGTFEVNISVVPTNPDGSRFLYMDVSSVGGTAMNVWDIWAGLPPNTAYYSPTLSSDVNTRNLQLANIPTLDARAGVTVFALGRMPISHYYSGTRLKLPLAPVDTRQAGGAIYATVFDYDVSAPPPSITFTMDSLATSDFYITTTVVASNPSLAVPPWEATCDNGTDCDNSWWYPQLKIGVPGGGIFFGGVLEANYKPVRDAHTWFVSITSGRPILTR